MALNIHNLFLGISLDWTNPAVPQSHVREAFWTWPQSVLVDAQAAVFNLGYTFTICIVPSTMRRLCDRERCVDLSGPGARAQADTSTGLFAILGAS